MGCVSQDTFRPDQDGMISSRAVREQLSSNSLLRYLLDRDERDLGINRAPMVRSRSVTVALGVVVVR